MVWNALVLLATSVGMVVAALFARRAVAAGFPLPYRAHRCTSIDGLRGYLALSVVASHFTIWVRPLTSVASAPIALTNVENNLGKAGVTVFFMITAFLFYPRTLNGIRAMSFCYLLITRLFRLYPLFLVAVVVSTALLWGLAVFPSDAATIRPTIERLGRWLSFTGLPDLFGVPDSALLTLHPSWSLAWEWLFYLVLLPITATIMTVRPTAIPTWAVPMAYIAAAVALRVGSGGASALHASSNYLTHFAAGMLVWEVCARPRLREALAKPGPSALSFALLLVGIVFFQAPGMTTLVFYVPFFACAAAGGTMFGLLSMPASLALGEASYGIYLLRQLLFTALLRTLHVWSWTNQYTMLAMLPLTMVLVVSLGGAAFLAIEKPMIARGHRIARRFRPHAPSASY